MSDLLFWYSVFVKIAEEIRTSVFEETGLTCSAGVGSNRLLAKVARYSLDILFMSILHETHICIFSTP